MDHFATTPRFSSLSLTDLLRGRDQFHPHLMHKANVVGTAIGRYLIRKDDPYPEGPEIDPKPKPGKKQPRRLENSEVRSYSWPCVLVFVSRWEDPLALVGKGGESAADVVPKTIYLEDGRSVPICVVEAPLSDAAPPPIDPAQLTFPTSMLAGGYPVIARIQGASHIASLGCLLTDGHTVYVLTSRHVAGREGEVLHTMVNGREVRIGRSSTKQIGRAPFEQIYETWPGKHVFVNLDVGLVEVDDEQKWNPSVFGLGQLGPLADLSVYNLTLDLIGCPVRAYGCASGRLTGQIAALFYRYRSVGGNEYVADFLIGGRGDEPLRTHPGDSGTLWVVESDDVRRDLGPLAVQWGGAVFSSDTALLPFALATNLSTVCRELEVDVLRSTGLASFEYWGAVGHYTIGSFACAQVADARLKALMIANRSVISFDPDALGTSVNDISVPGFVQLADVPDKVWKKTKTDTTPYGRRGPENPNHYADLDYAPAGKKSLDGLTPTAKTLDPGAWRAYYKSVGWNLVSQRGMLPFRVWQIYKGMVGFVSAGDVEQFIAAAGVLAHYVGDACQPLHGSYLDDGDPFRNPDGSKAATMLDHGKGYGHGVHVAYEDDMIDANVPDLLTGLTKTLGPSHKMTLIKGGQNAGFATIELMRRTRKRLAPASIVDAYGKLVLAGGKATAPATLWKKFRLATIDVIADGCRTLAMLWESAWVEGGGGKVAQAKLKAIGRPKLQTIYERQSFLPSQALGEIDKFL